MSICDYDNCFLLSLKDYKGLRPFNSAKDMVLWLNASNFNKAYNLIKKECCDLTRPIYYVFVEDHDVKAVNWFKKMYVKHPNNKHIFITNYAINDLPLKLLKFCGDFKIIHIF